MEQRKLLCIGHSHLNCVANSIAARRQHVAGFEERYDTRIIQLRRAPFHPNFVQEKGERRLAPHCIDALESELRDYRPDAVLAMINGQEYQVISIVNHPQPYDFPYPGDDTPLRADAEIIPYAVMRAQLTRLTELAVSIFLEPLGELLASPVYLVVPPPPIPDENHILAYPGPFAEQAKQHGIAPAPFRRKMWNLYRDVLKAEGERFGAIVLDPPAASVNDGYFVEEYWPNDPVHGNVKYGHAVFDMVTRRAFPEQAEVR